MNRSGWQGRLLWALGIGGTAVLLSLPLPPPLPLPQLIAFLLLAIWPATTWLLITNGPLLERALTAATIPLLLNSLLALLLNYLPGGIPATAVIITALLVAWWPLWHSRQQPLRLAWPKFPPLARWQIGLVVGLALFLGGLRFINLGYSEFQGDEGVIMVRAAAMITGDDAEIFLHQKGPLEILLPLTLWQMAGHINEGWARLPFAWGSVLMVGAVLALARRWFGLMTGLLAALFFGLNGFGVAFGRIVQYQSFVMLCGALALLYATRYAEEGQPRDLWATAVFLACGLLAHYDAVLVAPAVGWVLLRPVFRTKKIVWRDWLTAVALGAVTLGIFYLPFLLNPNFARTGQYLVQGRLGVSGDAGLLRWSGAQVWQMITFYNSLYYVLGLALLVLAGTGILLKKRIGAAAILYFLVPWLFYLLVVADPRTHVYTFFPGAAILAAAGAVTTGKWLTAQRLRPFAVAFFALFVAVTAVYVWLLFVDHTPERQRTWSENRPLYYPTTWDDPPLYGLFGFPHQAGWRLAEGLVSALPYASNEEQEITDWYMAQVARTHCPNFATFIQANDVQDTVPYDPASVAEMPVQAVVTVAGREGLVIHGRDPVPTPPIYDADGSSLWRTPPEVAPSTYAGAYKVDIVLGENQVRLLGYDLDTSQAVPGGEVIVTLYWQPLAPFDQNYQVFTHLYTDHLVAQHDGAPACAMLPTTRWEPGQIISDPHIISLPPDTAVGEIPLYTGMYNLLTSARLRQPDTGTDTIFLTDIFVHP